jgi:tRNA (guanine37-N1)-methyltransferase
MRVEIFTLFPELLPPYLDASILGRAQQAGLLQVGLHNIRDYATDKHQVTDDAPFGGGGGMVMKPEPLFAAVEAVLGAPPQAPVILLSPQGRLLTQPVAQELARHERLGLICGRYEGVDERVVQHLVTDEISIGDYVLTGGELPALILIDAVARNIPGVLGQSDGALTDSHATGILEGPHYTRPAEFRGWGVPEALLSGDHARIARWRREQALLRTADRRPDLLNSAELSKEDEKALNKFSEEPPFSFQATKNGKVLISWNGRLVTTLADKDAQKFLARIEDADGEDAQLIMAKATGNFKRGNERKT